MITLQNQQLTVQIDELGAQLHSIKRQDNEIEYLWQGEPASWNRQAPILFPFVGRLKDDQYQNSNVIYIFVKWSYKRAAWIHQISCCQAIDFNRNITNNIIW